MRHKIWLIGAVLAIIVFVFAACAPAAPAAAPEAASQPAASADGKIELRIAWWGSQNRHDRTIAVIEQFEQLHPNIDIVYEFAGWADYWTLMSTQAAGGNLADIMQQDYARLEEWVSRGLLAPLDDFVADGTLNFANISESALAGGRLDGKLYGVNLGTNSMTVVIDADKLAEAGLEPPRPDWTFDEFEQIATTLHEKLGIYGFTGNLTNEQLWKNIYLSLGQWVYNEDGTGLGYEDDQPFIDYLNMVKRLQDAGVTQSREQEIAAGGSVETDLIVSGQSAMTYIWSNQIVALTSAAGEGRNFIMVPMPRPAGGASANYLKPSMFFSITSQARHPKEAAMFIDFFTNNVDANKVLMAERGVPISSEVRSALEPLLNVPQKMMFDYIASIESSVSPIPPPDAPGHADLINNVYWPLVIDPFMFGQQSAEDAVRILREEASVVLAAAAR
ncbi:MULTISPECIES: ABC transporter substrate-binding protein [Caldilinea]|jgi:multiple sugar transport system substrate-binding protein|uniref:Putative ABC transporter substrate binding protein n=1 Tax=Caldilinea aerophila (strain DSM 14535 / JCM 11387 / NBRC 104270 / STL-6-O1) TaxID=926550 RepID=I0I310_CALAS|nr:MULTISPECIES: sugar ABC transporter substrate-binding protein [Caldilinea]BAL99647.1 putative ABC transporter substrate binding protein [Caldilinea aerophila DSM 14535 = NBRC 104270]GIV73754.1 MAG: ABC transporter substrate-binding protein [Caldilinea sp.]